MPAIENKPVCKLIGTDGNVFAIMATVSKTLKGADLKDEAKQMVAEVMGCGSYDEALRIVMEYVDVE